VRKGVRLIANPDYADDWIEHIIHYHAPARNVSKCRVDFLSDVREGRSGARISASHAPVADGREQHRNHCDQDAGDDVAVGSIA
jgi:hypothetical protein